MSTIATCLSVAYAHMARSGRTRSEQANERTIECTTLEARHLALEFAEGSLARELHQTLVGLLNVSAHRSLCSLWVALL